MKSEPTPTSPAQVTSPPPEPLPPLISPRAKAWMQLARLPNVFTAICDPLAGALAAGARWSDSPRVLLVTFASACLYTFGMMLNDWNDFRRDRVERPHRPIPSGMVRRWQALLAAVILAIGGLALASAAGPNTGAIGVLLVTAIIMYDVLLKEVPIAPGVMGICRALNLLLGIWAVPEQHTRLSGSMRMWLVTCMAVYVCGITIFARREARTRQNFWLLVGAVVTWVGIAALALLPILFPREPLKPLGYFLCLILLAFVVYKMTAALISPRPATVQSAVRYAIFGIILFDACIVAFTRGPGPSAALILLLIPAVWLGKWLYST